MVDKRNDAGLYQVKRCKGVSDKGVQELGDELGFHCQSLKELSLNFNE